jgi:hypothetical protein
LIYSGVQSKDKLGKFSGEMSNNEIIRDVFYGKVESVIDALLDRDNYDKSNLNAQIAYRFPELSLRDDCTNNNNNGGGGHDDDDVDDVSCNRNQDVIRSKHGNIYHVSEDRIDINQSQRIGMYVRPFYSSTMSVITSYQDSSFYHDYRHH